MDRAELDRRIAELDEEISRLGEEAYAACSLFGGNDDELCRTNMEKRAKLMEEHIVLIREQSRPILDDLKRRGFEVDNVQNLDRKYGAVPGNLLPVLIDYLHGEFHDNIKSQIAGVLIEANTRPYWKLLRGIFEKLGSRDAGYSDTLANVFIKIANKTDIPEIIDIIDSCENPSRLILLTTLKKFRNRSPEAAAAIERYRHDPEFAKEIASWRPSRPKIAKPKPQ